jgi:hypothetical protein
VAIDLMTGADIPGPAQSDAADNHDHVSRQAEKFAGGRNGGNKPRLSLIMSLQARIDWNDQG